MYSLRDKDTITRSVDRLIESDKHLSHDRLVDGLLKIADLKNLRDGFMSRMGNEFVTNQISTEKAEDKPVREADKYSWREGIVTRLTIACLIKSNDHLSHDRFVELLMKLVNSKNLRDGFMRLPDDEVVEFLNRV